MAAYFKYQTAKQINANRKNGIRKFWQRNYYDHIIRDRESVPDFTSTKIGLPYSQALRFVAASESSPGRRSSA